MEFNKKQMAPLIEKYQINVETNQLFKNVVELFEGQPNYQLWAVKCIFSKIITFVELKDICEWAEKNQMFIKTLSKQNIVSYSTASAIATLRREMKGIDMYNFVKNCISHFNTEQRKLLITNILPTNEVDAAPLSLAGNTKIINWYNIFTKFMRLPLARRNNFYSNCSTFTNFEALSNAIKDCLEVSYLWEKEDMLAFMANNTNCEVVHDEGNIVVLRVPDFKSSKLMCGNGRTQWCITKEDHYFKDYVSRYTNPKREQFFLFDFSRKETDQLAHIGFTVEQGSGVTNAHSCLNSDMRGGSVTVNNKRYDITKALEEAGVKLSKLMAAKKNSNYDWDVDSLIKFTKSKPTDYSVSLMKDNIVVVDVLTSSGLEKLIGNTMIGFRDCNLINGDNKAYVIFNFNVEYNDDEAIIYTQFVKDSYGTLSMYKMFNNMNMDVRKSNILSKFGISTSDFVDRSEIKPNILFHKLIDEGDEKGAIELIEKEGETFDVNYEFKQRTPIFSAVNNKMYTLFEKIVMHPKFNLATEDGFGETLLEALLYIYGTDEVITSKEEEKNLEKMINVILSNDKFNFNKGDLNNDTALMIACEYKKMVWVVKRLASKKSVDVNTVNGFNCSALTNCILNDNLGALEILGQRPDIEVRTQDTDAAKLKNLDLTKYLRPSNDVFEAQEVTEDELVRELSSSIA